jgi:hypothetical protein
VPLKAGRIGMAKTRRFDIRGILADSDLRRELMVATLQATQAREGVETTRDQAERAYYVVTEGERAAFFDLERYRSRGGEPDRREHAFKLAIRDGKGLERVRFDVARRDFLTIASSPLAYQRIGLVHRVFRDNPSLEPGFGRARLGAHTGDDTRYLREWWELDSFGSKAEFTWERFAKGGGYSRFYSDIDLLVHWDPKRKTFANFHGRKGREIERPESLDDFFKPGLTWPRRTQRGFNLRLLPEGCIFADKGPAIFPSQESDTFFILGVANSYFAEYFIQGLMSFGSWEVGVIKRLPIPRPGVEQHCRIGALAERIHDAKAGWDEGNEISTRFRAPWVLREDILEGIASLSHRLDHLAEYEATEEARIQQHYAELNDEVYRLYGISDGTRIIIEDTLGERPLEVLWPQMEGKSAEQKRIEHVFRLLSYIVKRVVTADEDGIVSFSPIERESDLIDRVHHELAALFPDRDVGQVEAEIANELKKTVGVYRRTASIGEWLRNAFFEFHRSLYRHTPIIWHLASSRGTAPFAFGALVDYHRLDRNRMAKLRSRYLREAIETFRREAALADKAGNAEARLEWQTRLEEALDFDRRLQWVEEGHHEGREGGGHDYRILTPWKTGMERPKGWDPDLDDGVQVNIAPLYKAGVLRIDG